MSYSMFVMVTDAKFQLAVQEFNSAMKTPPRGQRQQNLQIRTCLETVARELATCADLMVPSIHTLAASRPSLQRLKELSQNGGYFTMNRGLTVVDYGNWQYTTLLKAVQMLSTDISAAVLSISSHSGATTLRMNHDDTEAANVNQGNIVETCIGMHFPEPHDPLYNAQRARAMRDCIERVAHAIDVIYKVCRRAHMDKRGNLIDHAHTINLSNVAICTESTLTFACVLVALARIDRNSTLQEPCEDIC